MKILIASPTYDGNVRKEYMQSVMALTDHLRQAGIAWSLRMENATLLYVMRNVMASNALLDKAVTHILFIDTDMGFQVSAIEKLIAAKKDVIGMACPYRAIPWHEGSGTQDRPLRKLISQTVPYAVHFAPGSKEVKIDQGVCEVASIGTGIVLISTKALARMKPHVGKYVNHFPYEQWHKHDHYFGFFDPIIAGGRHMSEDYSFCHRWTQQCKGRIHAVVNEEILHVGPLPVAGRYLDRLQSGKV